MHARRLPPRRRDGGFSLPELMVSLVIALIALLAIGSVVVTNDRFQRATIGTSDAQTTGALALYAIERDARMAGYGLANGAALGCAPIQYYYSANGGNCGAECYSKPANAAASFDLRFAPVFIEDDVDGDGPDAITLAYANPGNRFVPGTIKENMPEPAAEMKLEEVGGFDDNELIVVFQPGIGCVLKQITQVQGAAAQKLQTNSGNAAPWNPVGGTSLFPAFTKGALVFNLGRPVFRRYDVKNDQLRVTDHFTYASATALPAIGNNPEVLHDQIVDLQAQYGKDTDGDQLVDTWDTLLPADWTQVLAVRIGVLARSRDEGRRENGACTATTKLPRWTGSAPDGTPGNSDFTVPGGIPSCYKFRVFETTIPLRNMIWRES